MSSRLWDIQVVLHAVDRLEVSAEFDGHALSRAQILSVDDALQHLEVWLESTPDTAVVLSVRSATGAWRQVSTRKWRVAAYFLVAHYEGTFAGVRVLERDRIQRAAREPSGIESNRGESVRTESGVIFTPQGDIPARAPTRAKAEGDTD